MTPTEWASAAMLTFSRFVAGTIDLPAAQAELGAETETWDPSIPELAERMRATLAAIEALVGSLSALKPRGFITALDDLNAITGQPGDVYFGAPGSPVAGDAYAWIENPDPDLSEWQLIPITGPAGSTRVDMGFSVNETQPAAGEEITFYGPSSETVAVVSAAFASLKTPAAAATTIQLRLNGVAMGQVTFANGSTTGVVTLTTINFPARARLSAVFPNPLVAAMLGLVVCIPGDR